MIGIRGTVFSFIADTKKKMIPRRHGYSLQGIAKFHVRTESTYIVAKLNDFEAVAILSNFSVCSRYGHIW